MACFLGMGGVVGVKNGLLHMKNKPCSKFTGNAFIEIKAIAMSIEVIHV